MSSDDSEQKILKILVMGPLGSGKTSYAKRWEKNKFEAHKSSVISEFAFKQFKYEDETIRIQVWDLADVSAKDNNQTSAKMLLKDAHGCVVICDSTKPDSIYETATFKNLIDEEKQFYDKTKLPCILVQTKSDLAEGDLDKLKTYAENNGYIGAFRTSAKTGENVNESMTVLILKIIQKIKECADKGINVELEGVKEKKIRKNSYDSNDEGEVKLQDVLQVKEEISKLNSMTDLLLNKIISRTSFKGFTNKIIKKQREVDDILDWISGGKLRNFKLIFSASDSENTKEDFHKKCDNKGSTLILVETVNGQRFGGFASLSWKCNNKWVKDPYCFLFNLDDGKKYEIKDIEHSYYGSAECGPQFGENDSLGIYNDGKAEGFLNELHFVNNDKISFDVEKNSDICDGENYIISAFEVYQVSI